MKKGPMIRGKTIPLVFLLSMICCPTFSATANDADIESAVRPLNEGVPQVAIIRLRDLLSTTTGAEEHRVVSEKLVETLLAADQAQEALKVLGDGDLLSLISMRFCAAQAHAALGQWPEALPFYKEVAATATSPLRARATLGQAETLRALGRQDEALQILASLFSDAQAKDHSQLVSVEILLDKQDSDGAKRVLDKTRPVALSDKKEKRYLQGRLEAQLGRRERALELFQTILRRPEGTPHSILIATLCAVAETSLRLRTPESGDDPLEDFIEHHPSDPDLPVVFEKLDKLYQAEAAMSNRELQRWADDPLQPRRALAQWYLAKSELRAGRRESASRIFAELRKNHPLLSSLAEGLFEFALLEAENKRFDEALAILQEARELRPTPIFLEKIDLLSARAHYGLGHFEAAAKTFETVARSSTKTAADSFYNASLAWLQVSNQAGFQANYSELAHAGNNSEARGDLLIEEGLAQAAQGNKKAADTLHRMLTEFPNHKRSAEAWVALAELAFHNVPANLDEARQDLARAAESAPSDAARERADYLSIWIEDAALHPDPNKIIELATKFLHQHETSSLGSDVRMKLAETYYRQQDFPNAQTQFQIVAQENSHNPLEEKALFFAAKSASQSMGAQAFDRALTLLDEVVKKNGDLKWAARNEQAVIERKLGKTQAATTLYDEVLEGAAKPEEKREALCGKGDILYEQGPSEPENYRRAIGVYDQLSAQKDSPPHWRNQALFKKGVCLEKLGERENSLASFYKIIEDEPYPGRQREFFWYYKAGFNAARLLEDDSQWQSAAAIYQRLVSAGGGRSDEAKSRLSRLRLEHFLWEQ